VQRGGVGRGRQGQRGRRRPAAGRGWWGSARGRRSAGCRGGSAGRREGGGDPTAKSGPAKSGRRSPRVLQHLEGIHGRSQVRLGVDHVFAILDAKAKLTGLSKRSKVSSSWAPAAVGGGRRNTGPCPCFPASDALYTPRARFRHARGIANTFPIRHRSVKTRGCKIRRR
jgi:hypothetical protein